MEGSCALGGRRRGLEVWRCGGWERWKRTSYHSRDPLPYVLGREYHTDSWDMMAGLDVFYGVFISPWFPWRVVLTVARRPREGEMCGKHTLIVFDLRRASAFAKDRVIEGERWTGGGCGIEEVPRD